MNSHILQKPVRLPLRAHPFSRWLYWPLWHQIRYVGKFGAPDRLGFVSLTSLGHRATAAPPPAELVPPPPAEEPQPTNVVTLSSYSRFMFLTEIRSKPTKPAA